MTLAAIVESSDDAIESQTLQGEITSWNHGAERIFGYSRAEVLGWNVSFLFPPDRVEEMQRVFDAVRRGESLKYLDTERVHKDGRRIPISLSVSPIKDRDGRVSGVSAIARDITESKQTKDLLARQARDLTCAYTGLEQINQELKRFAYAASHDLKEPLRMVTSYCQLLELEYGGQLTGEAGKYLRFAGDGAKRMQCLIDNLLSFSTVGMTNDPPEPVDLRVALDDALLNLAATVQESGVQFEIDELPSVLGNRTLLAMLFQNLIGNAIKFRRRCVPLVRVSCVAREDDWELTVADNGIGIEPEFHERVLGIFQRLHTRDEYPGTGIGLATCKKVVELHGGRIWLTSQPQVGTTMHFTLPCCSAPAVPTVVESPATTREPIETLLVEDNPGDIELAKAAFNRSPIRHHVSVARNGLEALALLRREDRFADRPLPSLILLDLNLSKKNGMDVLAEVKQDPSLKQIRVVVFTSSQTEDDIAKAQKLDADEFVTKPIEINRYFAVVKSIGERHTKSVQAGGYRRNPVRCRTDFYWGSKSPVESNGAGAGATVLEHEAPLDAVRR